MTSFITKFVFALILFLIGTGLFFYFLEISLSIVIGFLLFLVTDEVLNWFERKGIKEKHAIALVLVLLSIIVTAVILYVSAPFYAQLTSFAEQVPKLSSTVNQRLAQLQESYPYIQQGVDTLQKRLASDIGGAVKIAGSVIAALLTIPLVAIILLASRSTLRQTVYDLIPNDYFEITVTVLNDIIEKLKGYVVAKTAETGVMIVLHAIGFAIIGLPSALFLGILAGLLNLIPYIGMLVTFVPLALVTLVEGNGMLFVYSLIVVVIAQVIDNTVLQTYLIGKFVDIHPLIVLIVTLIGGEVLGALGLILAVPMYVVAEIVFVGIYQYLRALQRREELARE